MRNIIAISKKAGVQRIAYISGSSVRKENAVHPMIISHLKGERLVMESGIPWSIFRPTMILDTLPRYANNGKPFIIGNQPHKWSWIHTDDIARMVCNSFSKVEAENKKFTLFGPDSLTFNEAVDKFNAEFQPGFKKSKSTPLWMAKLMSVFIGKNLKYAVSIFQYFTNHPQEGNPGEANRILGKPIVGIEKFIEMHRNILDGKNA
jgi:nucleoside-diphosphate-sugar epimerase